MHEAERHQQGGRRGTRKKLRAQPQRRFYFSLARELGMTVAELLARISARELAEWMAFSNLEAEERPQRQLAAEAAAKLRARKRT
jgi:hypothetical protein